MAIPDPVTFIPDAVTSLLESPWQDKTGNTERIVEAHRLPKGLVPCYSSYKDDDASLLGFTYDEHVALAECGAFGIGVEVTDNRVEVHEHAAHSLQEFLGAVTIAWNQHKERLSKHVCALPARELPTAPKKTGVRNG